ncbi:2,3-diaminopropionate biosynthesis protein SbnB [Duganella sp. HSC-15S17]|jgi:ornithine cyclodeaminase|nr:2,3-diaminopropionate biosynthesis protein SbnB [Duganella violaceicalia]
MLEAAPSFRVIGGDYICEQLAASRREVIDLVRDCYLQHEDGQTVNPDSYFLRFPDRPEARIIALPAALRTSQQSEAVSGIKWIASYPRNIDVNLQRASAVILLNDYQTGYPFACLEASQISSARTAASAVLAAGELRAGVRRAGRLGIVGGGVIAAATLAYFLADGWQFEDIVVHDALPANGAAFVRNLGAEARGLRAGSVGEALAADIVLLTTNAGTPWIAADHGFGPQQLILNLSLRDLPPEIILVANNVFDDVEHCMKANTSPHLAEQRAGHRGFVTGTLAQHMRGQCRLDPARVTVFSPFGLGVLDLKLASFLYQRALAAGSATEIPGFFADTQRWSV